MIREISRRVQMTEDEGIACGPASTVSLEAEIVIDDNGKKVYLHGQWVDAAPEDTLYEAHTVSMFDMYIRMTHAEDDEELEALCNERDRLDEMYRVDMTPYESYIAELDQMIREEGEKHRLDWEDEEEEEDGEEE